MVIRVDSDIVSWCGRRGVEVDVGRVGDGDVVEN